MPLSTYVQNEFAFLHSSQIDAIYTVYSSTQIKTFFDSQVEELRSNLNGIITVLGQTDSDSGAKNVGARSIPGIVGNDVQTVLESIVAAGTGTVPPDGTISNAKLATDVKVGSLATLNTTAKTDAVSAINEVLADVGDISLLNTVNKTDVVTAINEINTAGEVRYFAMSTAPTGYIKANGAAISRSTYSRLFSAIGTTYGAGDGSTTFNLPDLRGVFPRGYDDGRGYDVGRSFGSYQADDNKAHTHTGTSDSAGAHTHNVNQSAGGNVGAYPFAGSNISGTTPVATSSAGAHTHTFTTDSTGATEVKVKNVALLACIKY